MIVVKLVVKHADSVLVVKLVAIVVVVKLVVKHADSRAVAACVTATLVVSS